ncbi:hypothetical protein BDA96_03G125000 [Sorghum bicolor]|uniref:Uncharacterized protein n=2 Tax=Sorghum bicolor TaxID=4558 RepID=A0A921RCD8_SORBI|nr:hypothetical protein BDA96_03G125000 [Sorghum bicolor]OQU86645.1 hypothetical protein SORBI_3003G119750 [Sorghum bicolor]
MRYWSRRGGRLSTGAVTLRLQGWSRRCGQKGHLSPLYGDCRDVFTVEIHHDSFFVGYGNLISYVDERVSWFDNIESMQLGHRNNLNVKVHWLLPGKTVPDGLPLILSDADTNVIATYAEDVKILVVYFDHQDLYDEINWDDFVANPVPELSKVISPCKSSA